MEQVEQAPKWLDKTFLQKALATYRNDDTIEILNFTLNTAFSEHYASTMFQSKIEFKSSEYPKPENEELNVVIKIKPVNDDIKNQVVAGGPLFENEIRMYTETIPAIYDLFERSGLKIQLAPE